MRPTGKLISVSGRACVRAAGLAERDPGEIVAAGRSLCVMLTLILVILLQVLHKCLFVFLFRILLKML